MRFLSALVLSVFASQAYAGGIVNAGFEGKDGNAERVRFCYSDDKAFKDGLKKLYEASDDQKVSAWQDLTEKFYKPLSSNPITSMAAIEQLSEKRAKPRANVRAAENILKVLSWDKAQVKDKAVTHDRKGKLTSISYSLKERYQSTPVPKMKSFDIKDFLSPNGQLTEDGLTFLKIIENVTFDVKGVGNKQSVTHAVKAVKGNARLAMLAEGENEKTLRWLLTSEHGHKARPLVRGCFFRGYKAVTGMPLVQDESLTLSEECLSYFENGMHPRYGRKEDELSEEDKGIDLLGDYPSLALAGIKKGVTGGWGNSCTRKFAIAQEYARGSDCAIFLIDSNHPDVIAHDVGGQYDQVNLETTPGNCIMGVWHPSYPNRFIHNERYKPAAPTPKDFDALFRGNTCLKKLAGID